MTIEKLVRTLSHKKSNDIKYILEELVKEYDTVENTDIAIPNEELSDEDIETIKNALMIMVEEDSQLAEKVENILDNDDRPRMADISPSEAIIWLGAIRGIVLLVSMAIKAKFPNKEKIGEDGKSKEIDRGYSNIAEVMKPLSNFVSSKSKKD